MPCGGASRARGASEPAVSISFMKTTRSHRLSIGAALVLAVTLGIGACSGKPASTPTEDSTANVVQSEEEEAQPEEVDGPTQAELQAYFEALATADPGKMAEAVEMAAPGSNAQAYAIYLTGSAQADRDAGYTTEVQEVETIEGGFAFCPEGVSENPCSEFTNIQHDGNQIADFDAGGVPLTGRLSLGNGEAQPLGGAGEATMVAAYKSISGAVVAVFEVSSASDGLWVTATYTAPDGRQSNSTQWSGPTDLKAGAFANYSFYFAGAEFGGTVELKAIKGDGYDGGTAAFPTQ